MSKRKSDLVRGYFAAFQAGDRAVMEATLADDFTFTSPYDDAIDRTTYFERCWPNGKLFRSMTIERICEDGAAAFVLYGCETVDGKSFRNTELHVFRGGRLRSVEVYFGAAYRNGVFIPPNQSS
ncbi:nuclear transport factor 2 family protein [Mesorhizobium sp. ESP6-5]|uniref:Ketosteroid isomerase-like protein n=1 Tax=Mesorhizobium australicum (strain HAMBI 3006 / LMG 24608 / WSM2073) TaxID=754035 RepID=L0KH97_MESAW|nr:MULTISPECIES: nuclear transport factor 2 family protein [Mesorhizobium]MBZ9930874.1 nuclear transport factor 2 family protein [Mesorhizobium sp. BR1-1-5]AGB43885.1 ketosteroid isomerase-like protein [Mesorhizobium australicum WSM2073]MBZ9679142.1 nuclear transport factor 2 family protein [Mesorhizobium sp. CO1-1-2]MBZ9756094.1 nuclear transport factor 2 family protein [Mesorhizobium sp. ESP6-5]MBZ9906935.1 nuclear transport factor 2 family protein [Mesorhizobium sp. BR115XR7A]